ncbi:MAG: DUF364 domain-containing protein [Candidatus Marinimicrobia bacterium]|jgi:uncharacterized protein (DUF4213/DUF364 family)|nr:DUF364 domain-containing protein [Candidatus Neomarinimicrobiota bacterium]MDD4960707.1 DUF364 domain-containing protein [Candidatus Neomarinimicrobiota bacterium]MDD5710360.1 DUF364 domain-containing protein [Candidatus Neomarinimicrobiota bacterium]MDX9777176.1 DUF364 domain-containing protein [bacterium]
MQILKELLSDIPDAAVDELVVGLHSVLVKSGNLAGIASTIKYCGPGAEPAHAGELEKYSLRKLAQFVLSENLLEASIGMAALNCALSGYAGTFREINAKDIILEKGRGKNVGIIGHFPFLEAQRSAYKNCDVFEKQPRGGDLREEDIPAYLPQAEIVAISGTTLTNHTFTSVMHHVSPDAYCLMLGPSTALSPLLFDAGLDVLSGTRITDYGLARHCVLQAVPTRHLKGVRMLSMFKEDYQ